MSARILITEDDNTFRSLLKAILQSEGYETREAENAEDALILLEKESFDLVLTDLKMPGMSGLDLFRIVRSDPSHPAFIVLTAFGTIEEAVSGTRDGVFDFLTKPLKDPESLRTVVRKALEEKKREREYAGLKEKESSGFPPDEIMFAGKAMKEVKRLISDVAQAQATVLIQGESGTGKELAAKTVHMMSKRNSSAFIPVNCAAIPDNLLESELFGHEKGAFTGAIQARRGKFELAHGGTLFLDEIGELPLSLQAKLLRVLQERKFERVGGNREISVDVRVVAATNRSLFEEVQEKRFRDDLYYRINVFPITLPPLRQREDAIPVLADYFIRKFSGQIGKKISGLEPGAEQAIMEYSWPGNIRELQNAIERAVILGKGVLKISDFPDIRERPVQDSDEMRESPALEEIEKRAIIEALKKSGNNRTLAADLLGISRRTLQYRIKDYGLSRKK
ncbi:sigma-54-dependent transcriptional regulator [Desulforegula conservatrix]|uniref:sigma-54-dependent transcriptional regulator n=1 Tax=Desulforegula conservatrix TaxID=153026 RepID=UPI0003FC76D7|nr:sigma-54 dependent transcriptional regulator [Desulforegula conservatrix]